MEKRKKRWISAILAVVFFAGLYFLNQVDIKELVVTAGRNFERAEVVKIMQDNVQEDGTRTGQQEVVLRMLSGPMKNQEVEATSNNGYLFGAACELGMKVIVIESISGDISLHSVYSVDRQLAIYGFVILFLGAVCIIGGKKGIQACVGLIFTFICIIYLYIPMIYRGYSPFLAAVLVAALTTLVVMYLLNGFSRKTMASVFGTVAGVVIAGASAWLFGKAAGISGYNVSNIESLTILQDIQGIHIGELLFSGLLISALGAVMDVGMSISSAIFEIHDQNGELTARQLFAAGMNVGRDMMGTMVNTLILAFAGGATSTLLLNYSYPLPYLQVINSNNICIEIMQGLSGSLGVVMTVPLVSWMAAWLAAESRKSDLTIQTVCDTIGEDTVPVKGTDGKDCLPYEEGRKIPVMQKGGFSHGSACCGNCADGLPHNRI